MTSPVPLAARLTARRAVDAGASAVIGQEFVTVSAADGADRVLNARRVSRQSSPGR